MNRSRTTHKMKGCWKTSGHIPQRVPQSPPHEQLDEEQPKKSTAVIHKSSKQQRRRIGGISVPSTAGAMATTASR